MDWQPIETAPKDGWFLGWSGLDSIWEVWAAETYWNSTALAEQARVVSHWMPLPNPPESK